MTISPYSDFTASSLKVMLKIWTIYQQKSRTSGNILTERMGHNEDVELLMTVPGIGIITATKIAAYTEDPDRFEGNYKKFATYIGNSIQHTYFKRIDSLQTHYET